MGTEPIFIRSVPKKDHRRLWTLFRPERVKLVRAKYHLHVKIYPSRSTFYPSRSIFFARVNSPSKERALEVSFWTRYVGDAGEIKHRVLYPGGGGGRALPIMDYTGRLRDFNCLH